MPKPCSVRNSALEQPSSIRNRRFALARRKKKKKKKMPPAGVAYFFHRRKLVEGSLASYPRQDGVVAARVLRDRGNRNICDANKHTEQTRPHISTIWGVRGGFGTSEKWNRGSVRYLVFFFLLLFFFLPCPPVCRFLIGRVVRRVPKATPFEDPAPSPPRSRPSASLSLTGPKTLPTRTVGNARYD